MIGFLSGMVTAGFLIASLFFFRFWKRTRDALFAAFGLAFALFASAQALSLSFDSASDDRAWVYLLRLFGFLLILGAIVTKNLGKADKT